MIIEYHRPRTIDEALELLARPEPRTLALGGGTVLNRPSPDEVAAVDLQALGLDGLHMSGKSLLIGAAVTLNRFSRQPGLQPALVKAINLELNYHLRQAATAAGALVSADGRSGFTAALLALDAELELRAQPGGAFPEQEKLGLGDLLPLREQLLRGRLITQVKIPLNVQLAFEKVARTPADLPIVCVALAKWNSGRTRLVVGGFGSAPSLALDGPEESGVEAAARAACMGAEDEWASAVYRSDAAATLAKRCLDELLTDEHG
jgi:CO/xanthine dehydrogenase FAD-binding subunit